MWKVNLEAPIDLVGARLGLFPSRSEWFPPQSATLDKIRLPVTSQLCLVLRKSMKNRSHIHGRMVHQTDWAVSKWSVALRL